jgi:hypothetical protein
MSCKTALAIAAVVTLGSAAAFVPTLASAHPLQSISRPGSHVGPSHARGAIPFNVENCRGWAPFTHCLYNEVFAPRGNSGNAVFRVR